MTMRKKEISLFRALIVMKRRRFQIRVKFLTAKIVLLIQIVKRNQKKHQQATRNIPIRLMMNGQGRSYMRIEAKAPVRMQAKRRHLKPCPLPLTEDVN